MESLSYRRILHSSNLKDGREVAQSRQRVAFQSNGDAFAGICGTVKHDIISMYVSTGELQ